MFWKYISGLKALPEWTDVLGVEQEGPLGVGTSAVATYRLLEERTFTITITEWEPNRLLGMKFRLGAEFHEAVGLEPYEGTKTRLTISLEGRRLISYNDGTHKTPSGPTLTDMPRGADEVQGLFTALITPFDEDGKVDHKALSALVNFQISSRVDGLYPCGSTGLAPLLNQQERKAVAETVLREVAGRIPVIIQVGSADTASTVELARHAEKAGADAVASLTPFYYKPGDAAVIKHFETIRESIGIPLFAYNIPQFTGNNLVPKMVASMARNSTISGIKDSSRDVIQLLDLIEAVPDNFVVMNGTEEYALYAMMMGGDGVVSGGASAYPELFQSMVAAYRSGDLAKASSDQGRILQFKEATKDSPIASYYEILKARGIDVGSPRPPFLPLESDQRDRLLANLKSSGMSASAKE